MYWSLPDEGPRLAEAMAKVRLAPTNELMVAMLPAYGALPASCVKLFADADAFERECLGLQAGAAAGADRGGRVAVPRLMCAVEPLKAVVMEQVEGTTLGGQMRRSWGQSRSYTGVFRALGGWLASLHAQKCPDPRWPEWLDSNVQLTRANLEAATPWLGPSRARRAGRLLEAVAQRLTASPPRVAYCHSDFQSENMILSKQRMYVLDFAYSGAGAPEQDLALLRHDLTNSFSDIPFMSVFTHRVWEAFLDGYGYPSRVRVGDEPAWDLFDLRYKSYSVRHGSRTGDRSLRRRLFRFYRYLLGVVRLRRFVDQRARAYAV